MSLCSKQQQGEVFIAAAQTLADGPSVWKNDISFSCKDAASKAVAGPAAFKKHPGFALVLFEGLEEPSSGHRGDGRGFEDPLHGYQWLQDVLKSANAAKALLMAARKEPGEAVS